MVKFLVASAPTVISILFATLSQFLSVKLPLEFRLLIAWLTILFTVAFISIFYLCRWLKTSMQHAVDRISSQQNLWFRLTYQAPFMHEIRNDEQERHFYEDSILRKLDGLAENQRKFGRDRFCSIFIGCLAFYCNEKRASVPWQTFRDSLVENFKDEILSGQIMPHVIDDHYKGRWDDLLDAARRKDAETR